MFGFWSCAASLACSIRDLATSALPETAEPRRSTLTIFSRPVWLSLAARYSAPIPEVSISSRRTNFPNFSFLAMDGLSLWFEVIYDNLACALWSVNKRADARRGGDLQCCDAVWPRPARAPAGGRDRRAPRRRSPLWN